MDPVEPKKTSVWLEEALEAAKQDDERSWVWGAAPEMIEKIKALEDTEGKAAPFIQDIKVIFEAAERSALGPFKGECADRILRRAFDPDNMMIDMALASFDLLRRLHPNLIGQIWEHIEGGQRVTVTGRGEMYDFICALSAEGVVGVVPRTTGETAIFVSPLVACFASLTRLKEREPGDGGA